MKLRNPLHSLRAALPGLLVLCLTVSGCRHHHVQAVAPPPPTIRQAPPASFPERAPEPTSPVLHTEIGIASWYGAPYHNARAANGEIYDENGMTAAHRTLPMGTVVRVTNLSNSKSVVVTISDRGPFVPGRILDLSRAAALKIGVWRTGTARVRIDVLRYPSSISSSGKWCVQIGVFHHEHDARRLQQKLQREYPSANVIDFKGATGYWVRIRPYGQSHTSAEQIARVIDPVEGQAYIVRLD
ncbi:MAG TPA: septal ring lytic transglycosylase RlpA family protein [Verrucomicrobiae bacterium]|nr:septal ring lytic transglycosylase RlpA family protein [Verrucomicrobiae bacterium]